MIRLMVSQMGGSVEDSKDIFHEGLMIMLEKIDNKDFVLTCKFKTFLYCVCENLWKAVKVKRQSATNYLARRVEIDSQNDFTESLDNKLYQTIFSDVFESLDKVSKMILKLYWDELSPQAIADKLGYTYGYVRKKKCEAQGELIEKIKMHPDYKRIINSENTVKNIVH